MEKRIWISWEKHRRSVELANRLKCELFIVEYCSFFRYPLSILKTISILIKEKPDILFVQNPSMLLAFIGCLYRCKKNKRTIVDRHSNFLFNKERYSWLYRVIFKTISILTIRYADITIITNSFLAALITKHGGNGFILPDRIPLLSPSQVLTLTGKKNILLISSFGSDEPIQLAIDAMRSLIDENIYLYVTGDYKKLDHEVIKSAPANVSFTGFLPEQEYIDMLYSVDVIMVLTNIDHCMLCGCYEAISARKPLITSNKKVLIEYFTGAYFVNNTVQDIAEGIKSTIAKINYYKENSIILKKELSSQWEEQFNKFEKTLSTL